MSFPSDFPKQALGKIFSVVKGEKPDAGQLALAVYELVGYGLFLGFGNVQYPAGISPQILELVNDVLSSLDLKAFKDLPVVEIAEFVLGQVTSGVSPWMIGVKVLFRYGPKALAALQTLLAAYNRIKG